MAASRHRLKVSCSFEYVADCLLPTLLEHYFWPDNHPVWLRMRGDLCCFMSEIILTFQTASDLPSYREFFFSFSAFLIFRFWEAPSLPLLLPVCYSCPRRCRLFVYGNSLQLCHSTKRCKWVTKKQNRQRTLHLVLLSEITLLTKAGRTVVRFVWRLQSHRLPHETLKWSLGGQQREFCQFPNGRRCHDLFSSLTFSPAAEFGIVFTYFSFHVGSLHLSPDCQRPCSKIHDYMKVCSLVLWLYFLEEQCKYPKWRHSDSLYIILISLSDNSSYLQGCTQLFILDQIDRHWFMIHILWKAVRMLNLLLFIFRGISELVCWTQHLLPYFGFPLE